MKKIGFFGGCFNPPTIAHLQIAKEAINKYNLDNVLFVPMNDFYPKKNLLSKNHRLNMLELLIKNEPKLGIDTFELDINKNTSITEAFSHIDKFYEADKYYIMGMDNFSKLKELKNNNVLNEYNFIIFDRAGSSKIYKNYNYIHNDDIYTISSSNVRAKIQNGVDFKSDVTNGIYKYITNNKLYLV